MPPVIGEFQRKIEIRPLVGVDEESGNEITHKIKQIFLNDCRVGYTGEKAGDPISIIRRGVTTDKETMAEIEAAVAAEFGAPASKVVVAPALTDQQYAGTQQLAAEMMAAGAFDDDDPNKVAV